VPPPAIPLASDAICRYKPARNGPAPIFGAGTPAAFQALGNSKKLLKSLTKDETHGSSSQKDVADEAWHAPFG
jgi:hypothetical protein